MLLLSSVKIIGDDELFKGSLLNGAEELIINVVYTVQRLLGNCRQGIVFRPGVFFVKQYEIRIIGEPVVILLFQLPVVLG
ncbi:hypothetical protein [Succinimonas sp.]|uniref:hypothetical protein n=1 Tax=Succinimonas sp. TaxID=1936151 RepID=UPI00386D3E79